MSDESKAHHPFDQMFKGMSSGCLGHMVELILERVVPVPAQRIDVAYVPKLRDPRLGVMDRMTALGPGMFEYFASPPSRAAVNECLRKRMNFEHELALRTQRHGELPPGQWLWILRLVARGSVSARAMVELRRLPEDHPLRMGAMPVLVAYQAHIMQDLKRLKV